MKLQSIAISGLFLALVCAAQGQESGMKVNPEAKSFRYSTTIEKERPELSEATRALVDAYRRNPGEQTREALRAEIARNYDKVVDRKRAKLDELKRTAKDQYKIDEMQAIVDEMERDREERIEQSLKRLTDARLRPGAREPKDGFVPVLGVAQNVSIGYAPVTNAEYAKFVAATKRAAPDGWKNGEPAKEQADCPVVGITYADAVEYCNWLSAADRRAKYRLPTEEEWEFAAGHMPKDADFNSGEKKGITPVSAYAKTLSASGAVDMWGNVWEWTSTERGNKGVAVKGGAWDSPRMNCRTEYRDEARDPAKGYANVGFRVAREK